jgi:uncharacterized protein (TIGR02001 family)
VGAAQHRWISGIGAFLALAWPAVPAQAQLGTVLSVYSDARFRNYSLSDGRPVGIFDLSYDDESGIYAGLSASAVISDKGPQPLSGQLNVGYVKRLPSGTTLEVGVVQSVYSKHASTEGTRSFTEAYVGIARNWLSSRIAFSPHDFEGGASTLYGETSASFSPSSRIHLGAKIGLLLPLEARANESEKPRVDWRLSTALNAGPATLHAFLTGGSHDPEAPTERDQRGTKFVLGVSLPL